MKESKIAKNMNDKGEFAFQYITMTAVVFAIIFAIVIGIFAVTSNLNVQAVTMDRAEKMQVSYIE